MAVLTEVGIENTGFVSVWRASRKMQLTKEPLYHCHHRSQFLSIDLYTVTAFHMLYSYIDVHTAA